MMLSRLITALQQELDKRGDCEVLVSNGDDFVKVQGLGELADEEAIVICDKESLKAIP
jgi:hypothetical protein